jgi:hypothetical protein
MILKYPASATYEPIDFDADRLRPKPRPPLYLNNPHPYVKYYLLSDMLP